MSFGLSLSFVLNYIMEVEMPNIDRWYLAEMAKMIDEMIDLPVAEALIPLNPRRLPGYIAGSILMLFQNP